MKEIENKYLGDFTKKAVKEVGVESPFLNFTDAVMSQVKEINENQATVYKPLISKTVWVLILGGFFTIIFYALYSETPQDSLSWFNNMELSLLPNYTISDFKLSKTLMYTTVLLGLMICIQVPILKHYFNKRLGV